MQLELRPLRKKAVRSVLASKLGGGITKQDQAKITRQEKVSTIVFLDAGSLYFLANIGFSPLFIVFIL